MLTGDASAFLAALQLADSSFPTGMYAHSQGLEGMVLRRWVTGPGELEEFLETQLAGALLPADGVALLNAHRSAGRSDLADLAGMDHLLAALKLPAELRTASYQMGRRLLAETAPFTSEPVVAAYRAQVVSGATPGCSAVALGIIAWAQGIPAEPALLGFCHSHVVAGLGAAMRLLRLSHSDCQGILHRLHPRMVRLSADIAARPWQDMTAFSPQLDLAAAGHEHDDLRMFAS